MDPSPGAFPSPTPGRAVITWDAGAISVQAPALELPGAVEKGKASPLSMQPPTEVAPRYFMALPPAEVMLGAIPPFGPLRPRLNARVPVPALQQVTLWCARL